MKFRWILGVLVFLLSACKSTPTLSPILTFTLSPTSHPPTATLTPMPTSTRTPTNTPHPEEQGIFIFDTSGENLQQILVGNYFLPKFNMDGQKVFLIEKEEENSNLLMYDRVTKELSELYSVQGEIIDIEVTPIKPILALLVEDSAQTFITLFDYEQLQRIDTYLSPENFTLVNWAPSLSWSYDARWLAFNQCDITRDGFHSNCQIFVWDTKSGEKPVKMNSLIDHLDDTSNQHSPAWSPDDYRLAFLQGYSAENGVYIIDFQQSPPKLVDMELSSNLGLLWSPDGSHFLVDGLMAPFVVNIENKIKSMLFNGGYGIFEFVSWLPSGVTIYHTEDAYSGIGRIHFYDPFSSDPTFPPRPAPNGVSAFSPDVSLATSEIVFFGIYNPTIPANWEKP